MKRMLSLLLAAAALCALCACAKAPETVTVLCRDETGAAVAGVKIQLCTDKSCFMSESGEDGKAVFEMAPGAYDIHVYKVPGGYGMPAEPQVNTTGKEASVEFLFPAAR